MATRKNAWGRSPLRLMGMTTSIVLLNTLSPAAQVAPAAEAVTAGEPTATGNRPLSMEEAIALAIQNNLDVQVNRYSPYASELASEAAWGAYDPVFNGDISYVDQAADNTFSLSTADLSEVDQLGGTAGLSALIPYVGASVSLEFDASRTHTNSTIEALSPKYDSGLTLGANLPLLRGLIWNQPWTLVKTSRLAYEADVQNFSTSIMDIVQSVINRYWRLVASKEQLWVAEKSLENNRALVEQTRVQYRVGVVSKVEVVQAEAGAANSEFNLIVSRNDYLDAQDALIATVLGTQLHADTQIAFNPTDNPVYVAHEAIDLNQAVDRAFANRPELAAAQKQIDQLEVALHFAKNQILPQLDLSLRYRALGTSGRQNPDLFDFQTGQPALPGSVKEGGFGDTFDSYYQSPREVTAMGVFSLPLGNTAARKNASKAQIELRQARTRIARLRQQIILSVRGSARGLRAAALGVEAAERRRIAAEEQLRAERIRLEHGESTPFDVLQRDRDLVDAESQKIAALQSYRVSQAALQREEGTILEDRGVVIENVRKMD